MYKGNIYVDELLNMITYLTLKENNFSELTFYLTRELNLYTKDKR